jgi:predicted Rossmann fold nucleotide-binding protein DprA/Smf involved in DNA uptake
LLYGAGDISRLIRGGLAIVGSRDTDEDGLSFTRRVAERCAGEGVQILSGGARGVDQTAVAAALDVGGGAVAVLAERLDRAATSREAKEFLRSGLLTLVSPYEPESGFTVSKAMGRNRYIYALVDFALVVRFTTGGGGTWAGAIEQLGRNKPGSPCVPVLVRVSHNPEDGCRELQSRGAVPFPEEEFWKANVLEILSRAARPPEQSPAMPLCDPATAPMPTDKGAVAVVEEPGQAAVAIPPAPPPEPVAAAPAVTAADTCYNRCLPLLLQHLRQEPGKNQLPEIAKALGLLRGQFTEWLNQAIGEGRVATKKKGRRTVYVDASLDEKQTLFDRGGDAA